MGIYYTVIMMFHRQKLAAIVIATGLLGSLAGVAQVSAPADDPLSTYEMGVFAQTHADETLEQRVSRLETFLFGAPQTGDLMTRRRKLDELLGHFKSAGPLDPLAAASQPARAGR